MQSRRPSIVIEFLCSGHDSRSSDMMNLFKRKPTMDNAMEGDQISAPVEMPGLADKLLRLQADFDNYRKRNAGVAEQARKEAQKTMLTELLPVRDNLLLALDHADEESSVVEGIEKILHQLDSVLAKYGLQEIDARPGVAFDPALHEAMATTPIPADGQGARPDGETIAEELQKGYHFGETVLRPAKVVVYVPD
jgi:molecular chaperone GrpE